jgi:hypothetical protein
MNATLIHPTTTLMQIVRIATCAIAAVISVKTMTAKTAATVIANQTDAGSTGVCRHGTGCHVAPAAWTFTKISDAGV